VAYQPRLTDFARHQLDSLPLSVLDTLLDCLNEIAADPYRDPHLRVTLVIPLYRTFPDAYVCGQVAIAYQMEEPNVFVVEAIGTSFYRP
jgi:hypothetical protein